MAARLYDAFQPDPEPEAFQWSRWIETYAAFADEQLEAAGAAGPRGDVLLVPARTGELAAAIARRGHRVLGLDGSSFFLRQGAQSYLHDDLPLQLRPAELSRLQLDRQFDFVTLPRVGFALEEGATAIRNGAARLLNYLRPGGVLMAQIIEPPPTGTPRGRWASKAEAGPRRPHLLPAGWQAGLTLEQWWDGKQRARWVHIFRVQAATREHEIRFVEERSLLTPADLQSILEEVGFVDLAVMKGAWPSEAEKLQTDSTYTVIIARKAGTAHG